MVTPVRYFNDSSEHGKPVKAILSVFRAPNLKDSFQAERSPLGAAEGRAELHFDQKEADIRSDVSRIRQ